jgi:CheY-like chemotaxis protein
MNKIDTTNPILLVEDDPMDVDLTLRAFKLNKLTNPVIVARDGEEVVGIINDWEEGDPKPLVILLDLNMPKIPISSNRSILINLLKWQATSNYIGGF